MSKNNGGMASIRTVFWIVFIGASIYAGFLLGIPYFTYKMFDYEVENAAKNAGYHTDEEIVKNLLEKAHFWYIPIDKDNIRIERTKKDIAIEVEYEVIVDFLNKYQKTLYFDAYAYELIKVDVGR
ncbi:MAG: hypothetical protein WA162_07690 [Thermodesulfobacteriota bacterium]